MAIAAERVMEETRVLLARLLNAADERDIIFTLNCTDSLNLALKGLLEPAYAEIDVGQAEVRATFDIPKVGKIAGCYVTEGNARRNARARVLRGEEQIYEGHVSSLKRFAKDAREVRTGFECGVGLEDFDAFEEGDIIQFYAEERE